MLIDEVIRIRGLIKRVGGIVDQGVVGQRDAIVLRIRVLVRTSGVGLEEVDPAVEESDGEEEKDGS